MVKGKLVAENRRGWLWMAICAVLEVLSIIGRGSSRRFERPESGEGGELDDRSLFGSVKITEEPLAKSSSLRS